mmetsp:Transcript_185/g.361  ORF Transcript_185/g.361 Transcript_185/m.361 type:complete len:94 (-) Transcript_185:79-360(-)
MLHMAAKFPEQAAGSSVVKIPKLTSTSSTRRSCEGATGHLRLAVVMAQFFMLNAEGKCWKAAMPATRIGGGSEQIKLAALKAVNTRASWTWSK